MDRGHIRSRGCGRGRLEAAAGVACLLSIAPIDPAIAAPDKPPLHCVAAEPYAGPALHAAIPAEALPGPEPALTGTLDSAITNRLDATVAWVLANTATPGITAAVGIPGRGLWSRTGGRARLDQPAPLAEDARFYWASAGKSFTAAAIMMLVGEGKLALDDPISKWFPSFPNAATITVDRLLTHTGGVFSFQNDLKFREKRGYVPPGDLIAIAARHGSDFCAGEYWYYSNTGYVMLARIIEQVEGAPYHEVIRRRIIEPLRLSRTVALAPRMKLASLATCYSGTRPDTDFDPSLPFGAGVIVGPADDMVRYWEALLTGRLLPRESVARMFERLYPMFDPGTFYGRGVMVYEFGTGADAGTWLGHSGGKEGCKAVVAFDVRTRLYVAVALNGDVSAEACANRLLKEASAGLSAASR